jgi:hypothetical protein
MKASQLIDPFQLFQKVPIVPEQEEFQWFQMFQSFQLLKSLAARTKAFHICIRRLVIVLNPWSVWNGFFIGLEFSK